MNSTNNWNTTASNYKEYPVKVESMEREAEVDAVYIAEGAPVYSVYGVPVEYEEEDSLSIYQGRWFKGLFNCLDNIFPDCVLGSTLPCISISKMYHQMGILSFSAMMVCFGVLLALLVVFFVVLKPSTTSEITYVRHLVEVYFSRESSFNNDLLFPIVIAGLWYRGVIMYLRYQIRKQYLIPGNRCEDFLYSFFCGCCAIIQMSSHLQIFKYSRLNLKEPNAQSKSCNTAVPVGHLTALPEAQTVV